MVLFLKGGVHICKLANGDLTWENLSVSKYHAHWHIIRIGSIYKLYRVWVVSHVGNVWIGPWANFPQYMDRTFENWCLLYCVCLINKSQIGPLTCLRQPTHNNA